MEYMGRSSLQATERYVKLLPPLDERSGGAPQRVPQTPGAGVRPGAMG